MTDRELKLRLLRLAHAEMNAEQDRARPLFVCHMIEDAGHDVLNADETAVSMSDYKLALYWYHLDDLSGPIKQVVRCVKEMQRSIVEIINGHSTFEDWLGSNGVPRIKQVAEKVFETRIAWVAHMIEVAEQEMHRGDRDWKWPDPIPVPRLTPMQVRMLRHVIKELDDGSHQDLYLLLRRARRIRHDLGVGFGTVIHEDNGLRRYFANALAGRYYDEWLEQEMGIAIADQDPERRRLGLRAWITWVLEQGRGQEV